ncbi:hypothetical protein DL96DRAFT_1612948 [Flagelloscypha sp. PMI_526]|nr:hypothetical protein DL96DRAFT_1612948 [Flagelloscypha sp. PMI_526]
MPIAGPSTLHSSGTPMSLEKDAIVFLVEDSVKRRMCWQSLRDHSLPKLIAHLQRPGTLPLQLFFPTGSPHSLKGPFLAVRDWDEMRYDGYERNDSLSLARMHDAIGTLNILRTRGFCTLHLVVVACLPVDQQAPAAVWQSLSSQFLQPKTFFHLVQSGDLAREFTILEQLFQGSLVSSKTKALSLSFTPAQNMSFLVSSPARTTPTTNSSHPEPSSSKLVSKSRKSSATFDDLIPAPIVEHLKQASGLSRRNHHKNHPSKSRQPFVSEDATSVSSGARSRPIRGVETTNGRRSYSLSSPPSPECSGSPASPTSPASPSYSPRYVCSQPPARSPLITQVPHHAPQAYNTASIDHMQTPFYQAGPMGSSSQFIPSHSQTTPIASAASDGPWPSFHVASTSRLPQPESSVHAHNRSFSLPGYPLTPASSFSSPSPQVERASPIPPSSTPAVSTLVDPSISAKVSQALSRPPIVESHVLESNPELKAIHEKGHLPFNIDAARATPQRAAADLGLPLRAQVVPHTSSQSTQPSPIALATAVVPSAVLSPSEHQMLPSPISPVVDHISSYTYASQSSQLFEQPLPPFNMSSSSSLFGWAG